MTLNADWSGTHDDGTHILFVESGVVPDGHVSVLHVVESLQIVPGDVRGEQHTPGLPTCEYEPWTVPWSV